ncbi:MAG: hypothetical protein ACE5NP_05300 [Anaerolineae bacterium]
MKTLSYQCGFGTHAVHAGEEYEALHSHVSPIYQTSTFYFDDMEGRSKGRGRQLLYLLKGLPPGLE